MTTIPETLMTVGEYFGEGYKPVLDFRGWRVAMLRYSPNNLPDKIHQVERHNATNEVFILTAGQADLILFEGGDTLSSTYYVFPMELNVAYNLEQSCWHEVVMAKDAHIILFERTDTSLENSNYAELSPEVLADIRSKLTVKG